MKLYCHGQFWFIRSEIKLPEIPWAKWEYIANIYTPVSQKQPEIHLFSARFKELNGDISGARAEYQHLYSDLCPGFLEAIVKHSNMEHRLVWLCTNNYHVPFSFLMCKSLFKLSMFVGRERIILHGLWKGHRCWEGKGTEPALANIAYSVLPFLIFGNFLSQYILLVLLILLKCENPIIHMSV